MDEYSLEVLNRLQREIEEEGRKKSLAPRKPRGPPKEKAAPKPSGGTVRNIYEIMPKDMLSTPENPHKDLHGFKIPFRLCCVAPSGSGKTNWLVNLIEMFSRPPRGTFHTIHVVTKNKDEPLYRFLEKCDDNIQITEGLHTLPQLDKMDKDLNNLVIVDDMVLEKNQQRICNYYIRARKLNCSVCYLSQSYFGIPKIIRNNCSYLIILKCSGQRELSTILSESGLGLDRDDLLSLYKEATNEKFSPLIIDYEADESERYRKGFKTILKPPPNQKTRIPETVSSEDRKAEE
jgi:Ni2+-binding GTPase involved in maturation of urease and hydrogenase